MFSSTFHSLLHTLGWGNRSLSLHRIHDRADEAAAKMDLTTAFKTMSKVWAPRTRYRRTPKHGGSFGRCHYAKATGWGR